ncbi:hypothetical protein ACFL1S_04900 [Pseudomonadota bacterium]
MSVAQKFASCLVVLVLLLAGCAGQVTQSTEAPKPEVRSLRNVSLEMSPKVVKKIANDVEFDIGVFKSVLMEALNSRQLLASDGDFDLNVVINEVRIRSTGSAVLFGFLAGDDHVTGEAIVLDRKGEAVYTYNANASYALGGFGGSDDTTRINWLYKKFSEIVSDELVEKRDTKE